MEFPLQPIARDEHGTIRFVKNRIVLDLIDFARNKGFNLNDIAVKRVNGHYTDEEMQQLSQLIGYSLSGYGDLSYVTDETFSEAQTLSQTL